MQNLPRPKELRNLCAYPHATRFANASAEKFAEKITGTPSRQAHLGRPRGFLRPSKPGSVYNLVEWRARRPALKVTSMDQLFFHPKVVHLPLALCVLMPLIAGGVTFACLRGRLDCRAWVIVFLLQGSMFGTGLVAMYTGGEEEERIAEIVPERYIEAHEEAAEVFVWASAILFGLMGVPLLLSEGELRNALLIFACIGSVVALALGYRAGEAGGRLVYEYGAASAYLSPVGDSPDGRIQAIEEYEDDVDSDE